MPAIKLSRRGWTVVGIVVVILAVAGWGIRAGYFPEIGKFFAAEPAGYIPPCSWHGEPITGFSAQCCSGFEPVGLAYAPVPTPATITPPPFPTGDGSLILKVQDPGSLYCTPDGTGYTRTPTYSWSGPALKASNTPVEIMRFSPSKGVFEVVHTIDTQNYASFTDADLPLPRPLIYQVRLVSDRNIVSNPLEFPVDCLVAQYNPFTTYCAVPTCSAEQRSVNCTKSPCEKPVVEMVCPPGVTVPPPRPSYTPTPMPSATPSPSCVPLPRCAYEGEPRCAIDPAPGVIYCPTPSPITPTPLPSYPPTPVPFEGVSIGFGGSEAWTMEISSTTQGHGVGLLLQPDPPSLSANGVNVTAVKLTVRYNPQFLQPLPPVGFFEETLEPLSIRNINPDVSEFTFTLGSGTSPLVVDANTRPITLSFKPLKVGFAGPVIITDAVITIPDRSDNAARLHQGNTRLIYAEIVVGSSTQPGDADADGDVDIFDYNLVVSNFGRSGPAGDLDGNGKVDIFDYNLVVSNFGNE